MRIIRYASMPVEYREKRPNSCGMRLQYFKRVAILKAVVGRKASHVLGDTSVCLWASEDISEQFMLS